MNLYLIIFLLSIIIIVAIIHILKREKYQNYPDQSSNKTKNIYSCWEHLLAYKKWDIDSFTEQQKKVLLTMRILNATTYADTKQDFPDWRNSCVIPSNHLLIFNRDPADTSNWLNLRYTKVNETPKGYVIDLDNYNEGSFKELLNNLYNLYDKEFIDESNRLQKEIDLYTDLKASKKIKLSNLQSDITINNATLNAMLAYDSQCQIDNRRLQALLAEIAGLRADIATVKSQIPIVPPPAPKSKYFSKPKYSWTCEKWGAVNQVTPVSLNPNGDVQCMSENARDCLWGPDETVCNNHITNPPQNINQLVCGTMHTTQWGGPGYEDPGHWCSTAKTRLSDGLTSVTNNNDWIKVDGRLTNVSLSGDTVCGTNSANEIYCNNFGSSAWKKTPGGLKQISIDGNKACGVASDNTIWCTDNVYTDTWQKIDGGLKQIDISGDKMCGVNQDDYIYCANFKQNNWSLKSGQLKHISISDNKACGISSGDEIWCADNIDNPNWTKIQGSLKQLDLDGDKVCGVNSGDNIYCGNYKQGNWTQLPGSLKYISVNNNRAYGVNSSDQIYYKNNI
jgi:hypothetical protein